MPSYEVRLAKLRKDLEAYLATKQHPIPYVLLNRHVYPHEVLPQDADKIIGDLGWRRTKRTVDERDVYFIERIPPTPPRELPPSRIEPVLQRPTVIRTQKLPTMRYRRAPLLNDRQSEVKGVKKVHRR